MHERTTSSSTPDDSYIGILRRAWPIMLANIAHPLLGLTDTAVIGHLGGVVDLGALALGSLVYGFVYWTFGFLRMGTTGFVAQAHGAGDHVELRAAVFRALLLAAVIGGALFVFRGPIARLALDLLGGSPEVRDVSLGYVHARAFGAPAALAGFAVLGTLIGLGQSRAVLALELVMNGVNLLLDLFFAGYLRLGARGVGLGTALAEWVALGLGLVLLSSLPQLRKRPGVERGQGVAQLLSGLGRTLIVNFNILLRTVCLLLGFAWFTSRGARFGDTVLAANHLLLGFISLAAFFLDGYAFVTESLVGAAFGARDVVRFSRVVQRANLLAAVTAVALALGLLTAGPWVIVLLTDLPRVRELAVQYLPYTALYVLLAVAAFQLDGIFIGVSRAAEMRNSAAISLALFLGASALLTPRLENRGLWLAFITYVVARGLTLGALYPRVRSAVANGSRANAAGH